MITNQIIATAKLSPLVRAVNPDAPDSKDSDWKITQVKSTKKGTREFQLAGPGGVSARAEVVKSRGDNTGPLASIVTGSVQKFDGKPKASKFAWISRNGATLKKVGAVVATASYFALEISGLTKKIPVLGELSTSIKPVVYAGVGATLAAIYGVKNTSKAPPAAPKPAIGAPAGVEAAASAASSL